MNVTDLHEKRKASPVDMVKTLYRHRQLILTLSRREVAARYRGSVMGLAWSFLNPVLMLIIYTFIFSVVFKTKWGADPNESRVDFALILFVGLIVHALFAECANRAPGLIVSNANYVKRVVFPLEILPVVTLVSAVFQALASLLVLFLAGLLVHGALPLTLFLFPVVLLPLAMATLGVSWLFSALGVYLRDIGQSVAILTSVMLFMSPVFFAVSALPKPFQKWIYVNPLSFIIEEMRAVIIWGNAPRWGGLCLYGVVSLMVLWAGFWCFQKTRKGFADVL